MYFEIDELFPNSSDHCYCIGLYDLNIVLYLGINYHSIEIVNHKGIADIFNYDDIEDDD
mgnify:CR=1 FL=1